MSTEIVQTDPYAALTEKPFVDQIHARQLEVIKRNVAQGLNDAEVAYFLELSRSLGLNPWAKEIWAAKSSGRDGREGNLLIMVGRDGLLRKAEEFPDYRGYDSGVVYEGDEFAFVDPNPDGKSLRERAGIIHRSDPRSGAVVGAWACAERVGRPVRRFYARLSEYMPKSEAKIKYSPWGNQVSVMIEKVPISVVHRTLCNLSGVYLQEEVDRVLAGDGGDRAEEWSDVTALVMGLDAPAQLKEDLVEAMARLNELSPGSWGLGRAQMTLPGRTADELAKELAHIQEQVAGHEALAEVGAVEEIPEAEIVPEEAPAAEPTRAEELRGFIADLEAALEDEALSAEERANLEAELAKGLDELSALS